MSKTWLAGIAAIGFVTFGAGFACAEDVSAKKIQITDNATDSTKRKVKVQSADLAVTLLKGDSPAANGASLHIYSATDDFCAVLPAGIDWKSTSKFVKYKNKATKNSALIKDRKLIVKINSGVTYTLADDGTQGDVNAQVQFGDGTKFCLRCSGNKKNDAKKFLGKDCAAVACDPEPSACPPLPPTTTTTTVATTTTTTNLPTVLLGALPATNGKFNFNLVPGLPGADAACDLIVGPGTHACSVAELLAAEAAGDLVGLKDTDNVTVTSFWAIDGTHADNVQCHDTPTAQVWNYATAHTGVAGERFDLTNGTGDLGPLKSGFGDMVFCLNMSWVGCCQ